MVADIALPAYNLQMNIRYATINDATMLAEMGEKTFRETFSKDNSPENIAAYLKKSFSPEIQFTEISEPGKIFLIAENEGDPIGYAQLILDSKDETLAGNKVMEIRRIYAVREFLGKGVGRELMQASIREAKERGCDSIWLGVWEKNPRAIDFYKRWGFKEVGTHVFMLGDDPQMDFIMELRLASA